MFRRYPKSERKFPVPVAERFHKPELFAVRVDVQPDVKDDQNKGKIANVRKNEIRKSAYEIGW